MYPLYKARIFFTALRKILSFVRAKGNTFWKSKSTIMAHGIVRVRNLKSGSFGSVEIHNDRKYDELEIKKPKNIREDGVMEGTNHHYVKGEYENDQGELIQPTLQEAVETRLKEAGIKPRKNSILALEYVFTISDIQKEIGTNHFFENYSASGFFDNVMRDFFAEKFGKENIISYSKHYDESTPHCHLIVIPIMKKEVKWKNRKGKGKKIENRLNARDHTGGKEKLRELQQEYFDHIKPKYSHYTRDGIFRGTLAEHQLRDYIQKTDHEIGQMRAKLASYTNDLQIKGAQIEIQKKEQEFEEKAQKLGKRIEQVDKWNRGDKWKKKKEFFDEDLKKAIKEDKESPAKRILRESKEDPKIEPRKPRLKF